MTILFALAFFSLGAVLASFAAVVAERLYTGESWVSGRSRCNSCAHPLSALDLVPVVSWALRRGRARCCGARVPFGYALGEIALGLAFLGGYLVLGWSLPLLPFLAFAAILAFIVMYDLRHTIVPAPAFFALMVTGLAYALLASASIQALGMTLLAAGMVGLAFFLCYAVSRGRAMGLADSPVAFALALVAGSTLAVPGLLFSFWIGGAVGIAILVSRPKGHRMGIEVPFVPFLAAGYALAYFTQWNPLLLTL